MQRMPGDLQRIFGRSLFEAQKGYQPLGARSFGEGLPHQIMKLADNVGGNTFRVAYTAFPAAVFVLDVFIKKSNSGIGTPLQIRKRVMHRYKEAVRLYEVNYLSPTK